MTIISVLISQSGTKKLSWSHEMSTGKPCLTYMTIMRWGRRDLLCEALLLLGDNFEVPSKTFISSAVSGIQGDSRSEWLMRKG